jgi:hypothetical protein
VALLHPIAAHLTTQVPHDVGDPVLSTALLWWNAHAVPLTARWWDGFFFAPAGGTMAFSDHRLGESLIASPLIWLGFAPVAAYNATLLLTFPLCAIAAHAFGFVLTRRHDAAIVAALVFGFSPYRFAHIEHLELLAAFGMPAALAALHLYIERREARWLTLFAAALFLQGLLCSYYILFFLVLLALWMVWFLRRDDRVAVAGIAAATLAAGALLAPIAWMYRTIHQHYGLTRSYTDIVSLSADVTSFVTASPLMGVWGWTSALNGPERETFPGGTVIVLALCGGATALWQVRGNTDRSRTSRLLAGLGLALLALAVAIRVTGPMRFGSGFATISMGTPFKTQSLAAAAMVLAAACSVTLRRAFAARSAFAFYGLAAVVLFVCSLGPSPALLGRQILYEPPYAWLMRIPVFGESVRVPARFAMPGLLALAAVAALSIARLQRPSSSWQIAAVASAIACEAWIPHLTMWNMPSPIPASVSSAGAAALVELPFGNTERDIAALYRAALAGMLAVNGYSGYFPPHYPPLRQAFEERDETVLDALAAHGPLLVAADPRVAGTDRWIEWLRTNPRAQSLGVSDGREWFRVTRGAAAAPPCMGAPVAIASIDGGDGQAGLSALTDHDDNTRWPERPAPGTAALTIDLGGVHEVCALHAEVGLDAPFAPGALAVATSSDGSRWTAGSRVRTSGLAALSALADPHHARVDLPLSDGSVRFIRLTVEGARPDAPWRLAGIWISGSAAR